MTGFDMTKLNLRLPIIQAPMAGVTTPALAAAVSNAGGMGSLGLGAVNAATAATLIKEMQEKTAQPFNVNFFTHDEPRRDPISEQRWLTCLAPLFKTFGSSPPDTLTAPYQNFDNTPDIVSVLLALKPSVVSFHFGLPSHEKITALKQAGIILMATVTCLAEAKKAQENGIDILVAQGIEAGGHRGIFDATSRDDAYSTAVLTGLLTKNCPLPVIAAGGIMDGSAVISALRSGAIAAQLGTAFLGCPETGISAAYRQALTSDEAWYTQLTHLVSGRPARIIPNSFSALDCDTSPPPYPIAYDAGKALHNAARQQNNHSFAAHWAGQGAPLCRFLPVHTLMKTLEAEMKSGL
ncbi:NAD(P)H-dependent flavin oxidoreductase [Acetobacter thailandicus]|uniref:NAD(P)H-dependent flavin oxidoreductase n=1 Tax=Acetobacter thailandicus TaxID=1502842 RepID=UPI0020113B38|nr:nitronate monooxygenase [Acetobacter thailandicus]